MIFGEKPRQSDIKRSNEVFRDEKRVIAPYTLLVRNKLQF